MEATSAPSKIKLSFKRGFIEALRTMNPKRDRIGNHLFRFNNVRDHVNVSARFPPLLVAFPYMSDPPNSMVGTLFSESKLIPFGRVLWYPSRGYKNHTHDIVLLVNRWPRGDDEPLLAQRGVCHVAVGPGRTNVITATRGCKGTIHRSESCMLNTNLYETKKTRISHRPRYRQSDADGRWLSQGSTCLLKTKDTIL